MSWHNDLNDLILRIQALDPRQFTATKCGHQTKRTGIAAVFDQRPIIYMPKNDEGSVDYCLDCIGGMSIRCARCRRPITIGSPIALYSPRDKDGFEIPEYAVVHSQDPLALVGCFGSDCAKTALALAGYWMPGDDGKGMVLDLSIVLGDILLSQMK